MTASTVVVETVEGYDWLSEMTDLYGKPVVSEVGPVRDGGPFYSCWYWNTGIGVQLRMERGRYQARVYRRGAEASTRGDEPATPRQVRTLLAMVGVLPCSACRDLREVPAGRDQASERWTACVCTGPSDRPMHGYVEAVARG